MDAGTSVLLGNWLDQAHKASTVKVLQDATVIIVLRDTEVFRQIFSLWSPQFWCCVDSNARWRHSLKGAKGMNIG